ncbi:MAG: hypothetical protein R2834_16825 [Rhodothermales bacterium]
MRYDILVFSAIGVFLLAGFAIQFLDLKGRGILYAFGALGALVGLPTLYRMRKTKLKRSIERRLRALNTQQLRLDELATLYANAPSIARTREALLRARADGLRQIAEIEAEARMPLAEAREYARLLTRVDLEAYAPSRDGGGGHRMS